MSETPANYVVSQYNSAAKAFADAILFEKEIIIAPALTQVFASAVRDKIFDPAQDKIIDIGCGPFFLALPFLRDGAHVDGIDIAPGMITRAQETLDKAGTNLKVRTSDIRLATAYEDLSPESYKFGMMNFVHQCCSNRTALTDLFKKAYRLLKPEAPLVLIAAHPHYLHIPHAAYSCAVKDSRQMKDGQKFTGQLFNNLGNAAFELKDEHYWSIQTLQECAQEAGFVTRSMVDLEDKPSLARMKSDEPAYLMMTFHRQPLPTLVIPTL